MWVFFLLLFSRGSRWKHVLGAVSDPRNGRNRHVGRSQERHERHRVPTVCGEDGTFDRFLGGRWGH